MRCILTLTFLLLTFYTNCMAQDCNAKFEVNAGPDIDVCNGGSVDLMGSIGGDATRSLWQGGKGSFNPDRNKLNVEYTPSPEESGTTVTLTLVANNPKLNCPESKSEIKISVNDQPKAVAGNNHSVCMENPVQLTGKVIGKAKKTTWLSNGNGVFDNENKLDAIYSPSEKDLRDGVCTLFLVAEPYGACMPDTSAMIITINKDAEFYTETNKIVSGGGPIELSITSKNELNNIAWKSAGSGAFAKKNFTIWEYSPSLKDLQNSTLSLQVEASDKSGTCTSKKNVIVHFKEKP